MTDTIREHYNLYYRYELKPGNDAAETVNSLYEAVMRNDKDALAEVIRILASNTYFLAEKRLGAAGMNEPETLDEVMQEIKTEVFKKAFRGFPEKVTEEGFFGYLVRMAEVCCSNYKKKYFGRKDVLLNEQEKEDFFGQIQDSWNTEDFYMEGEKRLVLKGILEFYMDALSGTEAPPYQVLTYCYAVLIPQMLKRTCNPALLEQIDTISRGKGGKSDSHYNEITGRLEGEIARDSVILMNWAMNAMHGLASGALDQEFLEIYRLEPLGRKEFRWGAVYEKNMNQTYLGTLVKELVITDVFSKNAMKNWPVRMANSLLRDTEKIAMKNTEFRNKSRDIAEDFFCR